MNKNYVILIAFLSLIFAKPIHSQICTNTQKVASASNIFTQILTESNQVAVNNDLNTVIYIHRNNAAANGGHSGQLRYAISTNGGLTWTQNQGILNPTSNSTTSGARYPNISIYNPTSNTNPTNAYLVYNAATVNSGAWSGVVTGVRKLDGTGNTENYNQAGATQTLIPRSMTERIPGEYWAIDAVWTGTATTGFRLHKGVWSSSTSDVNWTVATTLTPNFAGGTASVSDFNLAFDPSGMYGWACILTHVSPGPSNGAFYPTFYKTTDGGQNWTGPITVDLGDFSCVNSIIASGNVPSTAFDMDLTVDVNGNPHCMTQVVNGTGSYSVFFTETHYMADVTMENGVWNVIMMDSLRAGRATWGTSPNTVIMDNWPQISRTDDGKKIFFTWTDSNVNLGAANSTPDLWGKAYDVVTRQWTALKNLTSCNSSAATNILFPHCSPNVLGTSGNYLIPTTYAELNSSGNPLDSTSFLYLDSLMFSDNEFTIPQCSVMVSISPQDTIKVCAGSPVTLDAGTGDRFEWSTGDTTQTINVTTSGTYKVGVRNGCCIGGDSIVVIVDPAPIAGFSFSTSAVLQYSFTDTTNNDPTSWLWTFGDGNASVLQNPGHTYDSAGTYIICLTATDSCGNSDQFCDTINVTCPKPNASFNAVVSGLSVTFSDQSTANGIQSWFWDFGDGNNSILSNPSHTYATEDTFEVCLTIMDSCGSDTSCSDVVIDTGSTMGLDPILFGEVIAWPSPANETVNLSIDLYAGSAIEIRMISIQGKVLKTFQSAYARNHRLELDVRDFAKGIYLIDLRSDHSRKTIRFTVNR